ncbi:hypothetical protein [Aquabacterium humicola]|uniref:hypothetical protein n=1 Tax=Aquabacterium humicola TaxID=3237377 RepID=UPI0025432028|nr:hypothetical protein [Rubrivivax pictus]
MTPTLDQPSPPASAAFCDATVTSIEEAATTLTRASWQRGVPLNRDAVCWLLGRGCAAPRPPAEALRPALDDTTQAPPR